MRSGAAANPPLFPKRAALPPQMTVEEPTPYPNGVARP